MLTYLALALTCLEDPSISDVLQKEFKSASFTATVASAKQEELQKINKDFAQSYRFKTMDVWMKEPFMIRMESKVDDSDILMVINGPVKKISIPKARLSQKINSAKKPGQRQTAFDFGLVPSSLFNDFFVGTFIRTERRTGELVFDVTYLPLLKDKSRHRIWVDPDKHMVTKRQWFANRTGNLMATFEYSEAVNLSGVWFPTKVSVTNADGVLAGVTLYKNVKVNVPLEDKLFAVG